MAQIRVGLFGAELFSPNYGCSALAYTQIFMLEEIGKELNCDISYLLFSDDLPEKIAMSERLPKERIKTKYLIRFKTGIEGIRKLNKDVKQCDIIIDLTYGDSFSDIYGFKNFILYSLPKIISEKNKTTLILGPQTVGPFKSMVSREIAKKIIKKSNYIVARDDLSQKYTQKLVPNKDVILSSDLAMSLPYTEDQIGSNKKMKIGLNVSSLMWLKDHDNRKMDITTSYREIIETFLDRCDENIYEIHLITHVYEPIGFSEYQLAEILHKKYPILTLVAPRFQDPIEAKNYIARMDFFIGSRMHATIAAFSSGVPVIPLAYSRKFSGLYESLGYNHCVFCNKDADMIVKLIEEKINNSAEIKKECGEAYKKALQRNENYKRLLMTIIQRTNELKNEDSDTNVHL